MEELDADGKRQITYQVAKPTIFTLFSRLEGLHWISNLAFGTASVLVSNGPIRHNFETAHFLTSWQL